jgi:hypothetical protein
MSNATVWRNNSCMSVVDRRFELSALEQTADFGTLATAAARNRTVYLQLESSRIGNLVRFDSLYTL